MIHELRYFSGKAESQQVFPSLVFHETLTQQVANNWYQFSETMPTFLEKIATQIDIREQRKTLQEIAAEERGSPGLPHHILFENACFSIGTVVSRTKMTSLDYLNFAKLNLRNYSVLGYCFGLEIIANENIEFLHKCLSGNDYLKAEVLSRSTFFIIHRENENEHIKKNFENYLSYCKSPEDFNDLIIGFDSALLFWKNFWAEATELKSAAYNAC